ncbi:glycosyltransferase family 4 protein [Candidatus Sumerlaeota bacterium]
MRIGIDARYLNNEYSGIAKYSEGLLRALSALDQENEYEVYVHSSYRRSLALGENFRVHQFPARPVSLATMWRFGEFVAEHELDLLHSLFPLAPLTFDGPLLVTVHDLQALIVPGFTARRNWFVRKAYDLFYGWAYPTTIKRAKYVLADSRATRDDVARYFPTKKDSAIVVLPGLDDEFREPIDPAVAQETSQRHSLPRDFLLYVGSTRPNKNLPNMIRAFAQLLERAHADDLREIQDLCLVLVVNPDRFFSESRQLIRRLGIQEQVKVFNNISEVEKKAFCHLARALYFVTRNEGFGFPLLEAQACGTPVLAARHSSLPEIAGDAALLVDPDSVEAITDGLLEILLNESLRRQLAEDGPKNALRYTWQHTAELTLEVYNHLYK